MMSRLRAGKKPESFSRSSPRNPDLRVLVPQGLKNCQIYAKHFTILALCSR